MYYLFSVLVISISAWPMVLISDAVKKLLDTNMMQDLLVPVLGICPLLAVADSLQKGMWIGVVCMAAIICGNIVVSALRNLLPYELRLISILVISACIVTVLYLLAQAWIYEVAVTLGIYIPLIAINCLVLAFIEGYSLQHKIIDSMIKSIQLGLLVFGILFLAGTFREYAGLYLLQQPFGALLLMALIVAVINRFGADAGTGPHPDLS